MIYLLTKYRGPKRSMWVDWFKREWHYYTGAIGHGQWILHFSPHEERYTVDEDAD